jgi:hypothetical protein
VNIFPSLRKMTADIDDIKECITLLNSGATTLPTLSSADDPHRYLFRFSFVIDIVIYCSTPEQRLASLSAKVEQQGDVLRELVQILRQQFVKLEQKA